ncbi:acyloxyacyl hydrolase [Variovorax sp. JS1663]|uniref:acyloxyacyl hydrolase n=1 Tax=Variovorax sp. JS1663 TaxID=1851577 RepID=UPI000B346D69|nr:acyloxyacyl hydrolase [Variovorax sp. JS1663]OUM01467.1 lipid A 3-O-deacylase [Variovorax sp. JS1663]
MPNNKIAPGALLLATALLSSALPAQAFEDLSTKAVYVDAGHAPHNNTSTDSLTLGVILPWGSEHKFWGTSVTSHADLFVSQWRAPTVDHTGHNNFTQLGAIALWRIRFDEGASPWFAEAGIGITQMNDRYESPDRRFSTRFQFTEQFAVGRSFGAQGRHELSLRIQHFSNASIRKPNPGENFYKLRYAYRF